MTWERIDEGVGLWSTSYRIPGFPCRSSALRLPSGGYVVLSPGGSLAEGFGDAVGEAEVLVAVNAYHHMGLPAWQARFPKAVAVAHSDAHARLTRQGRTHLRGLDAAASRLPPCATLVEVPETRIGEVWLRVEATSGVVWCVGDAFFNLPRLSRKLSIRTMQRALRSAPGPSVSNLMKWVGMRNRQAFRRWVLAQLDADQPQMMVPVHGDLLRDDATAVLRELVERRL